MHAEQLLINTLEFQCQNSNDNDNNNNKSNNRRGDKRNTRAKKQPLFRFTDISDHKKG